MFGLQELRKDMEILKKHLDEPLLFWKKAAEIRRKELGFHYPDTLGMVEWKDHPKVVRGLIADSGFQSYSVRQEVLDLIKGL
jgi:hypothetical protein